MLTQAARCFWRREREILRASGRVGQVTRIRRNWVVVSIVSRRIVADFGNGAVSRIRGRDNAEFAENAEDAEKRRNEEEERL